MNTEYNGTPFYDEEDEESRTLIDEFRIRVSTAINNTKSKIADFLIKLATKFDAVAVTRANIGEKTTIVLTKYVPKDGQWHHFAATIDCWIMRNDKGKKKKTKKQVFVDGQLIKRRKK